jgi:predicted TIM-barrel fold metal-dependent hydrolase
LFEQYMASHGISRAVLLPLTRGYLPDADLNSVICAATNDWLAATWLGPWNGAGRYLGSIRVNPDDPDAAAAEIERWSGDPRMVQVGVPMESHQPYGQRRYFKIWETASRYSLPVALTADGGAGVEFTPTALGYPRYYIEYGAMSPLNFIYHLASLIAEGVFERLPGARFAFTAGGHDLVMPLLWRMDMDWMFSRSETPWVKRMPGEYLRDHVRFCTSRFEAPPQASMLPAWVELTDAAELLMFGTRYPHWSAAAPDGWLEGLADVDVRMRVLGGNAAAWYRVEGTAGGRP